MTQTSSNPKKVNNNLKCPLNNRVSLIQSESHLICPANSCECGKNGASFPLINQTPILLDQDNIDFSHNDLNSPIKRPNPIVRKLSEFMFGSNMGMKSRAQKLIQLSNCNFETKILIIGSGSSTILTNELKKISSNIVGIDIYLSDNVDYVADAHQLPFANESFDIVIIQAVLEHVLNPTKVVEEIFRVLQNNGVVYAETPFMQQVHEEAYDFYRFSKSGHRWLFKKFKELEAGVTKGPFTGLLWSFRYAINGLIKNKKIAAIACIPLFWIRYLDYLCFPEASRDGACELYFIGQKNQVSLKPKEIIEYYQKETEL